MPCVRAIPHIADREVIELSSVALQQKDKEEVISVCVLIWVFENVSLELTRNSWRVSYVAENNLNVYECTHTNNLVSMHFLCDATELLNCSTYFQ